MLLALQNVQAMQDIEVPKNCDKATPLTCPKLDCDAELEPGVCFEFDQATSSVIKVALCYDKENAK